MKKLLILAAVLGALCVQSFAQSGQATFVHYGSSLPVGAPQWSIFSKIDGTGIFQCTNSPTCTSAGQWVTIGNAGSGGTVTSVSSGAGLTGGPITGSGTLSIASAGVTIAMLSATGTPSATTYLRGDNTWATVAAGGLSGMTAGQVAIAATASTVTSSEALAGAGAGITTGPVSGTTAGHVVTEQGTTGQVQDSGTALAALAPLASPTFTGTVNGITANMVGLGNVTNNAQTQAAVVPNTVPSAGQVLVGNAGGTAYAPVLIGGDSSMTSAGVMTNTKINNTPFAGTSGHLVSFGAGNIPADSGLVAANQVNASSPGLGIAHFAGSTQTLTSSLIAIADLSATGTPSSTTYLRGDNTWATVAAGGLSGMTATQVPIAATATTVTSSKALQGTDTNILTAGTVSGTSAALCTDANGGATTVSCPSGGSGLSGMTAAQVPIAATASTITSSEALAGAGAGITTGPVSGTTAGHVITAQGTTGQIQDSGTALAALAPLASPTFTGTVNGITATMVGLGNVTNDAQTKAAIVPNTAPSAGQILVGNAGGTAYAPVGVSGDSSMTSAGIVTNTKLNSGTVPASSFFLGSNGSNQLIAAQPFVTNAQTTTYPAVAADFAGCKTIPVASGTFTITLVASGSQPASGQCINVLNYGSGVVTIARSGQLINGAAANFTLGAGSASAPTSATVTSDGTNYFATIDEATVGTVTSIATTGPITGGTITGSGTIACAGCVTSSSPGLGIAHFAGSTQAVTSSLIAIADLSATGTPSATTYLRGDNTWATVAAGGLSGMTAGQVALAATATTVTSSEALAGAGAGITTGPVSGTTAGHVVTEQGTTGQVQDSGTALAALAPLASPTFTGTVNGITATMVGLGNVTNDAQTKAAIVPNTAPSAGQILVGNAGGTAYAPVAASGDIGLISTGAMTVNKLQGNTLTLTSPAQSQTTTFNGSGVLVNAYSGVNVDAQTTDYTFGCPTDRLGEIEFNISSAKGFYLPQAGSTACTQSSMAMVVRNASISTAQLTLCSGTGSSGTCTPGSSTFQPEAVASVNLIPGSAAFIYSDAVSGTGNYHMVPIATAPGGTNVQTTGYAITALDKDKFIVMNCTSACVATLPAAPPTAKFNIGILSIGSTLATVSLNSLNFNGAGTAPTLATGHTIQIRTDGTNYFGDISAASGSSGLSGMTAGQVAIAATGTTVTSSDPLQGTDSSILTSGTVSAGTGVSLCTDASHGATTTGCPSGSAPSGTKMFALVNSNGTTGYTTSPAFGLDTSQNNGVDACANITAGTAVSYNTNNGMTISDLADAGTTIPCASNPIGSSLNETIYLAPGAYQVSTPWIFHGNGGLLYGTSDWSSSNGTQGTILQNIVGNAGNPILQIGSSNSDKAISGNQARNLVIDCANHAGTMVAGATGYQNYWGQEGSLEDDVRVQSCLGASFDFGSVGAQGTGAVPTNGGASQNAGPYGLWNVVFPGSPSIANPTTVTITSVSTAAAAIDGNVMATFNASSAPVPAPAVGEIIVVTAINAGGCGANYTGNFKVADVFSTTSWDALIPCTVHSDSASGLTGHATFYPSIVTSQMAMRNRHRGIFGGTANSGLTYSGANFSYAGTTANNQLPIGLDLAGGSPAHNNFVQNVDVDYMVAEKGPTYGIAITDNWGGAANVGLLVSGQFPSGNLDLSRNEFGTSGQTPTQWAVRDDQVNNQTTAAVNPDPSLLMTDLNGFWITDAIAESTIRNAWLINGTQGLQERQGSATPVFSVSAAGNTIVNNLTINGTCTGCGGGGGGTVTSFSSGNLSPLFTTSVATPTTTPALTFSLSNAGAGTFLGNNTSAAAGPAYVTLSAINPQTATYQVLASDFSAYKNITVASGTFTITLVASGSQPAAGQYINILNYGSGVVTVARSGQNINGAAANLTLNAGSASAPTSAQIWSDGTNYFATTDEATTGTITSIATTSPITGGTITTTGTIACATCVTSAASLTNNALMAGAGLQASQTVTTGTGVVTALGVNTGTAGAFVVNGGVLGTPSSGTLTNLTGLPINGVVSATGAITAIALGNNPMAFTSAQTTDAQDSVAFNEASAATNGTLTNSLANQAELHVGTASGSTAAPVEIEQLGITATTGPPVLQVESTWNNASLVGHLIFGNVTSTNSAASSDLLNLQVGNTPQAIINKSGTVLLGNPSAITLGTGEAIVGSEGTAFTGLAAYDGTYPDSTQHALEVNNNNTGAMPLDRTSCVNVTPVTIAASVTTDQLLMACSFNANLLNVVGRTLMVREAGVFSTAAASVASLTFKVKLCTVSGCGSGTVISPIVTATGATSALTASNLSWSQTSYITTQTAGASSAYEAHGFMTIDLSATAATPDSVYQDTNTATVGTIDSTGALFLQITVSASAASTSNSFTERQLIVEVLN